MTRREATMEACAVFSLVAHSLGDWEHASDGFCERCRFGENSGREQDYKNDGVVFQYVRDAVLEKLARDGTPVHPGFDPVTGRELENG